MSGPSTPRRTPAAGQRRGQRAPAAGGQRLVRTILLGTAAVVVAIAWLSRELGLDRDELLGYLGASVALVLLVVVLGMLAGGLLWLLRRVRSRRDSDRAG